MLEVKRKNESFLVSCRAARLKAVRTTGLRSDRSGQVFSEAEGQPEWSLKAFGELTKLLGELIDAPTTSDWKSLLCKAIEIMESITYVRSHSKESRTPSEAREAILRAFCELLFRFGADRSLGNQFWKFGAFSTSILGPEDSDNSITARKIAMNARFIYTVLFLVNSNEDELDVKRIPGVFEILKETLHIEMNIILLHFEISNGLIDLEYQ